LLREPEADGVRHGGQSLRLGWKIYVSFRDVTNRIHPKSHIGELRGLLPQKYSPLRANGDGLQSVYLAEVGRPHWWRVQTISRDFKLDHFVRPSCVDR
jgi:hypothetical protein